MSDSALALLADVCTDAAASSDEDMASTAWVFHAGWAGRAPAARLLQQILGEDWHAAHPGLLLCATTVPVFAPQTDLTAERTGVPKFLTQTPWAKLIGLLHCAIQTPPTCSVRGTTKAINAEVQALGIKCSGRDIVPRIAQWLMNAYLQRDGDAYLLVLPGYFTLRLDRKAYPTKHAVKEFFAYSLLGCSRDVVRPHWRFAECHMTVPGSLSLLRQMMERLPELVAVPWFKQVQ